MSQNNNADLSQQPNEILSSPGINPDSPQESNQPAPPLPSDIITVVHDPRYTLGKKFAIKPDGKISKKASVKVSSGIAVQHRVETLEYLEKLLREVGENPNAAIINAYFPDIPVGEEFAILSGREIETRLGIPRNDREKQKGVHEISYDGKTYKAVGRFKENVLPSCWQYLDRDVDEYTPEEFADLSVEELLSKIADFVPGMADISYLKTGSTSARVLRDGVPVGAGNGHVWFKVKDPSDIERFRTAVLIAAAQADVTWLKPRYSRSEPGKVEGHSLTTLIDTSVFTPGRLTFTGQPVVSEGLTVIPLQCSIHKGEIEALDTTKVVLPEAPTVREITRKAGVEMDVTSGSNGLRVTANDLTINTEIETEDHGVMTVREYLEKGTTEKLRCQTPFRDSSSFAAFISVGRDGTPFVYDSGTGITHWLDDNEHGKFELAVARGVMKSVIEKAKDDCGAPFEPDAVSALAFIKKHDSAEFTRIRSALKNAHKDLSVVNLDKTIREIAAEKDLAQTHHAYSMNVLTSLTVGGWKPVGYQGSLYVVDAATCIWVKYSFEALTRRVAEDHDGKDNCKRSSDYIGVADHAIKLATDDTFFANAPVGLACPDGFYQIRGNEIICESLSPSHRQRVQIDVTPQQQATPMFDAFLKETFMSSVPDEEQQQLVLVQEIIGAIMLGLMARHQKAVQFYDPYGRAGKGTLERILTRLVPASFTSAVSPFKWDGEYYLASLAGSRLNTVGELSDSKPIPAAPFKTVTGGDLLTGRHPTHRPFTFKNEAAHLFMSNHLITTNDHSEAFFTRWLIVEFPNSRLCSGLPIDPDLADRIIQNELPGIAQLALEGARRLMEKGSFSKSIVHDRLMAKWRRNTNSLEEFIHEDCDRGSEFKVRRSHLYEKYKVWCSENGRRPFAKSKVKELLAHNIGLGVSHASLDGHEIFRGIKMKDTPNITSV
ncbi:phage/plasmid primase, P4 family [uncultured Desulfobulbus sp.]|uniref:DNA primase family protein n=1 Tax=uncultured Desulfobulbus sp. TaxID=239745 RepID=UPI0029C6F213|nr:phage/plasmid primase, P4 family [uncultured Desulfobulbus sp.]